jgi:hypothetical protein
MHLKFPTLAAAALAALALAPSANAAFLLSITEPGGGPGIEIEDGMLGDTDGVINGSITANVGLVNPSLMFFQFDAGFGAKSNRLAGTPGSLDVATLNQNGTVVRNGLGGVQTLIIEATDTDFEFPGPNPKFMNSAATGQYTDTLDSDTQTFQSFFDETNMEYGMSQMGPLQVLDTPGGLGPFNDKDEVFGIVVTDDATDGYSLTNVTEISLAADTGGSVQPTVQFTGATTVTAVPEPSALALALLGLPTVLIARRFRRPRRAALA